MIVVRVVTGGLRAARFFCPRPSGWGWYSGKFVLVVWALFATARAWTRQPEAARVGFMAVAAVDPRRDGLARGD